MAGRNQELKFEIINQIGVISTSASGWIGSDAATAQNALNSYQSAGPAVWSGLFFTDCTACTVHTLRQWHRHGC